MTAPKTTFALRFPEAQMNAAFAADMVDVDDKSPHCSCGSGDGSDAHGDACELVAEGFLG